MEFNEILILFFTGILGGTIAGLFGIGGGIIYVLVYSTFIEDFSNGALSSDIIVQLTILNSVFSIFVAALIGSYKQYRLGNFYPRKVFLIGISGAVAALIVTRIISTTSFYNQRSFLIFFTLAIIPLLIKFIPNKKTVAVLNIKNHWFSIAGLFAGAGSALSGLGGGFILNPLLYGVLKFPLKRTFSVALGSMLFTTTAIIFYHLSINDLSKQPISIAHFRGILFPIVLPVIAGVFIGSPLGVALAHRLKSNMLSILFFIMALIIIIRNCILIFAT